ncbi:PREDICTED: uncharacterized protein LOC104708820 [Camelina sativa]|uniref:Uncharacterized protein LOC104708820 n=1 Tax=Camelina sativa TaxID=90675 RepID=A0ABM1QCS1_CAMSA|nr:PREDICTED: uncharacterized protein LOC104708820 [Camelina sativa]XP_010423749.1 PREDICTED: uncharacterized protein LOC104708820 [Camelina sativa]XP_010423750.1 PREDICTED: uncharacterized protein LOC104708820 [Camelina sativa]XP_010423751.1 PREDICTED: uncharacterized protein LOC104708820 [Camelina sativa]XP_019084559.1 PREDICTED: uncharacterized protein LOC104708820 [Camelina sativa]
MYVRSQNLGEIVSATCRFSHLASSTRNPASLFLLHGNRKVSISPWKNPPTKIRMTVLQTLQNPDVRPYKTAWRVQVKVLHAWRQSTGESLELIVSDSLGKKIHASVKKELVTKYANRLPVGNWVFIETFGLSYATGQFRPTTHLYKMAFITGTLVLQSDPVSEDMFLSLSKFQNIQSGEANPHILVDAIGQIVSVGDLENLEANNKPNRKLDFELRDETDERMTCTLWGSFAERVFRSCQHSDGSIIICVLCFVKIKSYKGVRYLSNSFDASQVHLNPLIHEVDILKQALPSDGLTLMYRARQPNLEIVPVQNEDYYAFPRKNIEELKNSFEIGKARLRLGIT